MSESLYIKQAKVMNANYIYINMMQVYWEAVCTPGIHPCQDGGQVPAQ